MTTLLPCPFCNDVPNVRGDIAHKEECYFRYIYRMFDGDTFTEPETGKAWNTRATPEVTDKAIEAALRHVVIQTDSQMLPIVTYASMRAAIAAALKEMGK